MIKIFLLLTLLAAGSCSNYDEDDVMNELGRDVIERIGKLQQTTLTFDEVLRHNVKTKYDSTLADHVTTISLRMIAHDVNDVTIKCDAEVSVQSHVGEIELKDYDCDVKQRRSSEDCSVDEKMELMKAAMTKVNEDQDAADAMLDFPGFPSMKQPHHVFDLVESCFKVKVEGGQEFKLEVKGHQSEDTVENCVIRITKHNSGHYDVTQNQCQGNNQ